MIFVDTSAWYAAIIPSDENHKAVSEWLDENTEPPITTDYIVDETLTLLRARGESKRALLMGERFWPALLKDGKRKPGRGKSQQQKEMLTNCGNHKPD
jgi:predicted nucleic acid-binding protein